MVDKSRTGTKELGDVMTLKALPPLGKHAVSAIVHSHNKKIIKNIEKTAPLFY